MNQIYIPADSPEDWKRFLAEPDLQWKDGYSAKSLAMAWQNAKGFPADVKKVFQKSGIPVLQDVEMLLAIPEHQVPLPGGGRASQSDIFVLGKANGDLISIVVEGKVDETFGPLVSEWFKKPSVGKKKRLAYLRNLLGLEQEAVMPIRYQLLHRTASALLMAEKFNAPHALMLVHSFSKEYAGFEDYKAFCSLFKVKSELNKIHTARKISNANLSFGWIKSRIPKIRTKPIKGTVIAKKCPRCGHHEVGVADGKGSYRVLRTGDEIELK